METLNVKSMQQDRSVSKSVSDTAFYGFRRQVQYKSKWLGGVVVLADTYFASTKTCSRCKYRKKKMHRSTRRFSCHKCGLRLCRDVNAAINLKQLAVSSTVSACGENVSQDTVPVSCSLVEARTKLQMSHLGKT